MNKWKRILSFLLLLLLFVLASCTDFSLFTPAVESAEGLEIRSIREGGTVTQDESISFVIHAAEEEDLNLEIELRTSTGESVWTNSISDPLTNEELELLLPDLETGQYQLLFLVSSENGMDIQEELNFFYADGVYAITGITSYPPTVTPDAEILLEVDLEIPAEADPFIRWSQEGTAIASGTLEEGLNQIRWQAPGEPGVYSIQVELFPVQPSDSEVFTSSIAMTARIYISAQEILSESDLTPEDAYYSLFHFNGHLKDSGLGAAGGADGMAETTGNAVFTAEEGYSGYRLEPGSGISYPHLVLPVKDGHLQPFTLTMMMVLDPGNSGSNLFYTAFPEGLFQVYLNDLEQLSARLTIGEKQLEFASGIEPADYSREQVFSLSIIPGNETVGAIWFSDGYQTAGSVVTAALPEVSAEGSFLIGGDDGFSGVITEMGIYFQDPQKRASVDPFLYKRAMEGEHEAKLLLAEGFDGIYFPDNYHFEGPRAMSAGSLLLGPESSLTSPPFELIEGELVLEIGFAEDPPVGSSIRLYQNEEILFSLETPFELDQDRALSIIISPVPVDDESPEGSIRVQLKQTENPSWLFFQIEATVAEILAIDRITLYQNID